MAVSKGNLGLTLSRTLIALLFLVSGLTKLAEPTSFLAVVLSYRLPLPGAIAMLVTIALPWFEIFIAAALLTGFWRDAGLVSACGLAFVFIALSARALWLGRTGDCGCFGALSERLPEFLTSPRAVVIRNVAFAVFTGAVTIKSLGRAGEVPGGSDRAGGTMSVEE